MTTPRETWLFRIELPPGEAHGGRLVARLLKHLLRSWGIRATAIVEAPPDKKFDAAPSEGLASK
jgi:hypothetical protein